jgi:GTP pyrophosphokinase
VTTKVKEIVNRVESYLAEDKVALIEKAYHFATECHDGQTRVSGEPYVEHPFQTALFLADLHLDFTTIAAALLHDVIEDCDITYEEVSERFGEDVAKLVDGVTKLTRMDLKLIGPETEECQQPTAFQEDRLQAESLRKMLVAMAEDVRVVLIKLADRLHNMRTLGALALHRRQAIAQETLDIYSPLAHRLGIWDIKWRLEDMAFRHLEEDKYREISKMLSIKREERESYISRVAEILKKELDSVSLDAQVIGRPKHIYSIYQKIQKYAIQGKELGEIYDLYALRVLVKTKGDCYNALGVVHDLWHPMPGQFDDYIANPKDTLYQSLHTTVMCEGGAPLEVQIRTYDMHQTSEYGVAAHWRYKEGGAWDIRLRTR